MNYDTSKSPACLLAVLIALVMGGGASGGDYFLPTEQKASPIPAFRPRPTPVVTGEFIVGVITITFKETRMEYPMSQGIQTLEKVTETFLESGHADASHYGENASAVTQGEYFKIFSNGIAWPKLMFMPSDGVDYQNVIYQDPNYYGYYCEHDPWTNPFGWKDEKEGRERVAKMNQSALRFATNSYRGPRPLFLCYNYITTRPEKPDPEIRDELFEHYTGQDADKRKRRSARSRKSRRDEEEDAAIDELERLRPWFSYEPICRWGQPMWPNSKIQINDFHGGVFAHELGHCLGAPDTYHAPRYNDGIAGAPCPFAYGPTSHAFSRYYHHAYIKERNHPTIKTSGTYTLHPRHIDPKGDEAVGYLIPSNHPHYLYQVEYVYDENDSVGIGPRHQGMLITVLNLGLTSYLGSPDYAYVYRPNDPFFRGKGDVQDSFFGKAHGRTSFTMDTNPSARLPNLLDGGVSLTNIEERDGTLTFDLQIEHKRVSGSEYTNSMLPQIRLDAVTDVQATSFTMDCTIKFRGEPLKTIYGFCWSTSRNPTVRDENFILAHREWYRGHAINLRPSTTYYVRAFATNGLGIRYSDEEEMVKTADPDELPANIGPLLTDAFSQNGYLFRRYSNASSGWFLDYSPVCTLAKLVAYYRPGKFSATRDEESGESRRQNYVDFNQLSWNPGEDDNPKRLLEIDAFFSSVHGQIRASGLHEIEPGKELVSAITKLVGTRGKPVVDTLTEENAAEVCERIRKDLELSRPVLLIYAPRDHPASEYTRWALVDGVREGGDFHVDFPMNSEFQTGAVPTRVTTGYRSPEELMIENYSLTVITSLYLTK